MERAIRVSIFDTQQFPKAKTQVDIERLGIPTRDECEHHRQIENDEGVVETFPDVLLGEPVPRIARHVHPAGGASEALERHDPDNIPVHDSRKRAEVGAPRNPNSFV